MEEHYTRSWSAGCETPGAEMSDQQQEESSYELFQPVGGMWPLSSVDLRESPLGSRATRDDLLCAGDLDGTSEGGSGRRSRVSQNHRFSEDRTSYDNFATTDKKLLLKTLIAAESAATSAAVQLVSFRDILEEDFSDSRCSSELRLSRQKGLLLEKLEVFKRINASVRQQLKEFLEEEMCRTETDKHIDALLKKLALTERENQDLRLSLSDRERKVEELMALRKKEMENTESVVQLSRSVDTTRAHLQLQLRNKEAENNRLMVQLRALERTVAQQKLELEDLRAQMDSVSAAASEEKEALKKATRAQKLRAERFESAVEKLYDQLREKDVKLAEVRSERDRWRCEQETATEERVRLDAEITSLKEEISVLNAELQRERQSVKAASDLLLEKVEKLNSDNAELTLQNSTLKATVAELEEKLQESHAAFRDQTALTEERKHQVEEYQSQIAELQVEVTELKIKLESQLQETRELREGRDEEVAQVDGHAEKLKSSLEMKDSIKEANAQLQQKVDSLQKKVEEVQSENQELISRLSSQEGALQYSSRQLEQRSAECQALRRQLESALTDVAQQVCKVKEKASSRENTLQTRILELEAEKNRRENELKQLRLSKVSSEKQFEMRLKDLQLSLDQSESHKQSIQNYVDFLKNSYATMFEDTLPSTYGSSYYLK
ncbi:outer dense fiber protein 2-like isoform X3 [Colossoma macropomum]|uniref:outer dense fiber protein 2-like isoform X3 n=1 Tax=Colossoma macropomum TaxID=42526 RepID=UPI0018653D46|nr:outer dense fiber protein 2-like isoform X3 [Colossoma macropomum]